MSGAVIGNPQISPIAVHKWGQWQWSEPFYVICPVCKLLKRMKNKPL
jgi:hypothetical protein